MQINQNVNIHNRFDVFVNDEWAGYAENIVLDQMWSRLCSGSTYFVNIHFGTGQGTPLASRTSLFTHLGTKVAVDEEIIKASPVSRWKRKIVLNPEEFVGATLTEVGIAFGSTASNLVTHAMLRDAEGNPISILKKDTDVVTIFATVFVTFQMTSGVTLASMPSGNALVNYLVGGTTIPAASFGMSELQGFGRLGSTANVTWNADVPTKKRKTNLLRFDINTGNGQVLGLDLSGIFTLGFPTAGVFEGQNYTAVPVGTGDGVTPQFFLPSDTIYPELLITKIGGVISPSTLIQVPAYRALNMVGVTTPDGSAISGDGTIVVCFGSGSDYNFQMSIYRQTLSGVEQLPNPTLEGTLNWYRSAVLGLSYDGTTLLIIRSYDGGSIFIYDLIDNKWVRRTTIPNGIKADHGKVSRDGQQILIGGSSSGPIGMKVQKYINNVYVKDLNLSPASPATAFYFVEATPDFDHICGVSYNGNTYVYVYNLDTETFNQKGIIPLFSGARSCDISDDGLVLAVSYSASPQSLVRIFDWIDSNWVLRAASIPNPSIDDGNNANYSIVNVSGDGKILNIAWRSGTTTTTTRTLYWDVDKWIDISSNTSGLGTMVRNKFQISDDGKQVLKNSIMVDGSRSFRNIIKFPTPPASGAVITADYKTKGLHKTNQYVVDVSAAIQFGEGV